MKFTDLGLCPELLEGIAKLGFETPTPVQGQVIPYLLENERDVVALAQTGTGKTAAFGLPSLEMLDPEICAPQTLILCPTRELCMQIARDLNDMASCLPKVRVLAVYGGADIRHQLDALRRGVQIVVATPGRMLDIIRRKRVDFSSIRRVVLDEADEMLNMGFEEDLEGILSDVPKTAQTFLFSATMPKNVAQIARNYMDNPHEITVGSRNAGAENVSHEYYVVHAKDRYRALQRIVDACPDIYGIVFCRTRIETQQVSDKLRRDGYNAEAIHGDLSQQQRDSVMKKFRDHHVQMLVATDVAARGLDVDDLTHVINYNLPDDLGSYTHRSGRTGRAGKAGISVTIINMREHFKIERLQKSIGKQFTQRRVPSGEEIARLSIVSMAERIRDIEPCSGLVDGHLEELNSILADLSKEEIVKRFIANDLNRMLQFYRDAPDLNVDHSATQAKQGKGQDQSKSARQKRENHEPRKMTAGMTELVMNVGKANGLTPKNLMAMVNVADRESSIEIGRINIVKMQAYFEVPRSEASGVIESFARKHVDCKGRQVSVAMAGNTQTRSKPKTKKKQSPQAGRNRKHKKKSFDDKPFAKYRSKKGKSKKTSEQS